MTNSTRDNTQNPQDRKDPANINDPNKGRETDATRRQQQAEQTRPGQQSGNPQPQRPDDKRDQRKPQQQS